MPDIGLIIHPYSSKKDVGFGHDRYAYEISQRIPKYGYKVKELTFGKPKGMFSALWAEVKAILFFKRNKQSHGVFHATATLNAQCGITAGIHPLVTTIHDVLWFHVKSKFDSKIKYWVKTFAIKRAAKSSDAVIVPFESTKNFLVEKLGVPEKKVHIVPYGIDEKRFYPKQENEVTDLEYFPKKGPVVLFIGALQWGKGIDSLIKSFDQVVDKVPDAQLVIGSSGWNKKEIQELASRSRYKNQIHFVGFIPEADLRKAYLNATVSVFPSRYGFGLTTLESMACGIPTISGRVLDAPEFIQDAGLMVDPENPTELAGQIVKVLKDSNLRQQLGKKGLERASHYLWETTAKLTVDVYKKVHSKQ